MTDFSLGDRAIQEREMLDALRWHGLLEQVETPESKTHRPAASDPVAVTIHSGSRGGAFDKENRDMDLAKYVAAGVADFKARAPGRNEPSGEPLAPQVVAYWDGWNSSAQLSMSDFTRAKSRKAG